VGTVTLNESSAGLSSVGFCCHSRVNCADADQPPRFGTDLESFARTRQKYEALSNVAGGE
jgi:hypothetical protein